MSCSAAEAKTWDETGTNAGREDRFLSPSPEPAPARSLKRKRTKNDAEESRGKRSKKRVMARKECIICCAEVTTIRFPKLHHVDAQQHTSDVCLGCWNQHLKSEVESKGFEGVGCPQCSYLLQEPEVRRLAQKSTYSE